ncbi:tetratricopeptide repeat protein [Streptomyces sp. NPDC021969]|uniref:tetratricopeptide repeat protein n=1 Tax=unclassified Streptomyces TaxID=2593676 RepID=UPI0033F7B9BB
MKGQSGERDTHEERLYFVENPETARLSDLNTAVEANEAHLAAHPDCPLRWLYQAHTGDLRTARGERTESRDDLVRAAELLREASADPEPSISPGQRGGFLFNLGNLLTKRQLAASFTTLSEGVDAYRQALELLTDAERLACVSNMLPELLAVADRSGRPEPREEARDLALRFLDEAATHPISETGVWNAAIKCLDTEPVPTDLHLHLVAKAESLVQQPAPDDVRGLRLHRLERLLNACWERTGERRFLIRAVEAGRQAVALCPTEGKTVANLALALKMAGALDGDPELLAEAVRFFLRALELTPAESDDHPTMRGDLAGIRLLLSEYRDQEENLRAALHETTEVVEHGRRTGNFTLVRTFLPNLALARLRLGMVTDDRGLKADALDAYREALKLHRPPGTRARLLANYGSALAQLAAHDDRPADKLHEADQAMTEALVLLPDDEPQLGQFLRAYAVNALTLTVHDHTSTALDRAIDAWERILARATACSLAEPAHLCRKLLAVQYWRRYDGTADVGDLGRAVDHGAHVLRDPRQDLGAELLLLTLYAVSEAYRLRALVTHDPADFEHAIASAAEVLEWPDLPQAMRQDFLTARSAAHNDRFNVFGRPSDLDAALAFAQQAVAVPVPTGPKSSTRHQLAACLSQKYQQSGLVEHLDRAVEIWRAARSAIRSRLGEDDDPLTVSYTDSDLSVIHNLSTTLAQRYQLHQIPSDLDEALDAMAIVLRHTLANRPARPDRLTSAANMFRSRCSRDAAPDDLSRALSYAEEAVATARPGSHTHLNAVTALLAIHTDDRDAHGGGGSEDDGRHAESRDRAIELGLRLAESADVATLRRGTLLTHNTAMTLRRRWRVSRNHSDLDRSISLLRQVLQRVGLERSPLSALALGWTLLDHSRTEDTACSADAPLSAAEARREAAAAFRSVATSATAPTSTRFQAARDWATVTGRPDEETLAACRQLMELLPLVAWVGAPRAVRETVLDDESALTPMAALAAVEAGRPADAVEFLELGRGVLWSQSLDLRTDLTEIEEADPELGARLAAVREALDTSTTDSGAADLPLVAESSVPAPPDPVDPDWEAVILRAEEMSARGDRGELYDHLGPLTTADDPRVAGYAEFGRGLALIDRGEPEAAREALARAAAHDSPFAFAAANTLGDLLVAADDYEAARAAYERARDSADQEQSGLAAASLRRLDEIEAAENRLDHGLARALVLGDVPELLGVAVRLLQQSRFADCRLFVERAFPRIPPEDQPSTASFLALVRGRTGDVPGARNAWEQALTSDDPETVANAALGLGDLLAGEYTLDEARSAYARAQDFPDTADEARAHLAALSVPSPEDDSVARAPRLAFDYGHWLAHRRPAEEALAVLEQALAAGCADPRAHYYVFEVVRLRSEPSPQWMRERLHRVLARSPDPGSPLALITRARLRQLRGDEEGAVRILDDAYGAALARGDAELAAVAALVQATHHQHVENVDAAHDAYQRAIRSGHPELSPTAANWMAVMLDEAGRGEEARATYRHVMISGHPVQGGMAAFTLGMSLGRSGDVDGAVEAFSWAANGVWEQSAADARTMLARLSTDGSDSADPPDRPGPRGTA